MSKIDKDTFLRRMEEIDPNDKAARREAARAFDAELTRQRQEEHEEEPPEDPIPTIGRGLEDAVADLLAKMKPASPAEIRASNWKTIVLPRLETSRIEKRYRYDMTETGWNCLSQQKTFEFCREKFTGTGAIVALVGVRGAGKTAIAAQLIIARAFDDIGRMTEPGFNFRPTPYRKMADLIARFKPLYADFGTTATDELTGARDALLKATLMIIDECHDSSELKMRDRILTDFLDRSYSKMNDVLLISNEKQEEFEASVGSSVMSRLREHGCIVKCEWPSWREGERRSLARHG